MYCRYIPEIVDQISSFCYVDWITERFFHVYQWSLVADVSSSGFSLSPFYIIVVGDVKTVVIVLFTVSFIRLSEPTYLQKTNIVKFELGEKYRLFGQIIYLYEGNICLSWWWRPWQRGNPGRTASDLVYFRRQSSRPPLRALFLLTPQTFQVRYLPRCILWCRWWSPRTIRGMHSKTAPEGDEAVPDRGRHRCNAGSESRVDVSWRMSTGRPYPDCRKPRKALWSCWWCRSRYATVVFWEPLRPPSRDLHTRRPCGRWVDDEALPRPVGARDAPGAMAPSDNLWTHSLAFRVNSATPSPTCPRLGRLLRGPLRDRREAQFHVVLRPHSVVQNPRREATNFPTGYYMILMFYHALK